MWLCLLVKVKETLYNACHVYSRLKGSTAAQPKATSVRGLLTDGHWLHALTMARRRRQNSEEYPGKQNSNKCIST